jgi:hypothetical protein
VFSPNVSVCRLKDHGPAGDQQEKQDKPAKLSVIDPLKDSMAPAIAEKANPARPAASEPKKKWRGR